MCLEDLGIKQLSKEQLKQVSTASVVKNIHMNKMPFNVTPDMVAAAIIVADKLGHYFKKHGKVPGGLNDLGKDCLCSFKK